MMVIYFGFQPGAVSERARVSTSRHGCVAGVGRDGSSTAKASGRWRSTRDCCVAITRQPKISVVTLDQNLGREFPNPVEPSPWQYAAPISVAGPDRRCQICTYSVNVMKMLKAPV